MISTRSLPLFAALMGGLANAEEASEGAEALVRSSQTDATQAVSTTEKNVVKTSSPPGAPNPRFGLFMGVGADVMETKSLRLFLRTRHALSDRWSVGPTVASRGPGMAITLDADHIFARTDKTSFHVGPRVGASWRMVDAVLDPYPPASDYTRTTTDLQAGGGIGFRRGFKAGGMWGIDVQALASIATWNAAYSYRVAPVSITADLQLGLDLLPTHTMAYHGEVWASRHPVPIRSDMLRAKRLRDAGVVMTTVGLVGYGITAYWALREFDFSGPDPMFNVAFATNMTTIATTITGGVLWGVGNTRIRRLKRSVALVPRPGGATAAIAGTF